MAFWQVVPGEQSLALSKGPLVVCKRSLRKDNIVVFMLVGLSYIEGLTTSTIFVRFS